MDCGFDDPAGEAKAALVVTDSAPGLRNGACHRHWPITCDKKRMKTQHREGNETYSTVSTGERTGSGSAGQSGDTQGLSDAAEAGTESVQELLEEGQAFEAEATSGVEDARDPDVAEVHTRQVPEDDVPPEYLVTD